MKTSRLTSIQVLRGIAASLVVLHHFTQATQTYATRPTLIGESGLGELGAAGVDLFFVISGFIMIYTTKNRVGGADALDFVDKRLRRVLPLYWVWTTALLLLKVSGLALRSHDFPLPYIIGSYLLVPVNNGDSHHPLLDQGWTLSFEMLFYAVFALAMCFTMRAKRVGLVALLLSATFALGLLLPSSSAIGDFLSDSLIFEFLFGMIAAELTLRIEQPSKALAWGLLTLGSAGLLATMAFDHHAMPRGLVWGLPSFAVVLGMALMKDAEGRGVFVFLGDASYSIYLTHAFVTLAYGMVYQRVGALKALQPDLVIVASTLATIAGTSLSYLFVEKPLNKLLLRKSSPSMPSSEITSRRASL